MWNPALRLLAILGGVILVVLLLGFGATALAHVAGLGDAGSTIGAAACVASAVGWYLIAAGCWGAWHLGPRRAARIRTIRACLAVGVLLAAYMLYGLPLNTLSSGSPGERMALTVLSLFVVGLILAAVIIGRYPRQVAWGLLPFAIYSVVTLVRMLIGLTASGPSLYGAAIVLSFLLASMFAFSVIAAFRLAWPLRLASIDAAT